VEEVILYCLVEKGVSIWCGYLLVALVLDASRISPLKVRHKNLGSRSTYMFLHSNWVIKAYSGFSAHAKEVMAFTRIIILMAPFHSTKTVSFILS
jgi:hypothetical protein